jgi:hypothetical protein
MSAHLKFSHKFIQLNDSLTMLKILRRFVPGQDNKGHAPGQATL